jgi:hypothetical protein
VLGVPKDLTNKEFKKIFVEYFGDVSHAYIKDNLEKNKNIGFVTFKDEVTASVALKARTIKLGNSTTLSIKRFTAKEKTKPVSKYLKKSTTGISAIESLSYQEFNM